MRVTRAIKEYIENQVNLKTKPQLDEIEAQIKKWDDNYNVQKNKFTDHVEKEITKLATVLYPKLQKIAPKDAQVFFYTWSRDKKIATLEYFVESMAECLKEKIYLRQENPYKEKREKFLNLREQKITEIILQLELGAKREELQEMLSNITIEV